MLFHLLPPILLPVSEAMYCLILQRDENKEWVKEEKLVSNSQCISGLFCDLGQIPAPLQFSVSPREIRYRGLGLRTSKVLAMVQTPLRKSWGLSLTLTLDLEVSHVVQRGLQHLFIVGMEKSGLILGVQQLRVAEGWLEAGVWKKNFQRQGFTSSHRAGT